MESKSFFRKTFCMKFISKKIRFRRYPVSFKKDLKLVFYTPLTFKYNHYVHF